MLLLHRNRAKMKKEVTLRGTKQSNRFIVGVMSFTPVSEKKSIFGGKIE